MSNELESKRARSPIKATRSSAEEIATFLARAKRLPAQSKEVNILFGLDLTASRSAALVEARKATAAMFHAVANLPRALKVAIKLGYYRGANECRVAKEWLSDSDVLCGKMERLSCEAGGTQIGRMLKHALKETESTNVNAMVFIGDCYEEDEDELLLYALKLKEASVTLFVFHECSGGIGAGALDQEKFRRLADAAGGAYCAFDESSSEVLCELLLNIAVYSSSGDDGLRQIAPPQTSEGKALRRSLLQLAADTTRT